MGTIRILSRSDAPFADRREAGRLLARELEAYRTPAPVVLGIPRGGVVVAAEIAESLGAELDIVLARKIGAPGNPELASGAVSEDGQLFLDERIRARLGASPQFVAQQRARQIEEIARRVALYRAARPKVPLQGRVVILADDGLATGSTMQAALWAVRREQPGRVIVAVPVGAPDTVERLAASADEMLCLRAPEDFGAVGRFYRKFDQTPDEEVVEILGKWRDGGRDSR
jgi:predicted phosphoribosyltransferase